MISRRQISLALFLLAASFDAAAVTSENCANFEKSVAQGKAVTTDSSVLVAIAAKDPTILDAKFPVKTAKRKLQSMFLKYCGDYSGYKTFQVDTRGGASGTLVCSGKTIYAFAIKKTDITIKETSGADGGQAEEIPDLEEKNDLFEEFK